jgi:hypothetical protein
VNSTSNRKSGNVIESISCVSNPITLLIAIRFSVLKIRKMIIPKDKLCSEPKIQKIFVEFITFSPVYSESNKNYLEYFV